MYELVLGGSRFSKTHDEIARWLAVAEALRARWVALTDTQTIGYLALEHEILELYLSRDAQQTASHLVSLLPDLAETAQALARSFSGDTRTHARRHECAHCRSTVFLTPSESACSRCGAPAPNQR